MTAAGDAQPAPTGNGTTFVQVQVIADLMAVRDARPEIAADIERVMSDEHERLQHGVKKYGTGLQVNNGRDATVDAYQEALDLVNYLKQALLEKKLPEWMYRQQLDFVVELATWIQR